MANPRARRSELPPARLPPSRRFPAQRTPPELAFGPEFDEPGPDRSWRGDPRRDEQLRGEDNDLPQSHRRTKAPWWLRLFVLFGILILVLSGSAIALFYGLSARYDSKVEKADILGDVPITPTGERWADGPLNLLVLTSDAPNAGSADHDPAKTAEPAAASTGAPDTIMVLHLTKGLGDAFVVSIPRDASVDVPPVGDWPGGQSTIISAFAFGGTKLVAKVVYELTKVPLDGALIVDLSGVQNLADEVGGVDVCLDETVESTLSDLVWEQGCRQLPATQTEEFMQQQGNVRGGDLARLRDQHLVITGVLDRVIDSGLLTEPSKLDALLSLTAEAVTVDQRNEVLDLVFALKSINPKNIEYVTVPQLPPAPGAAGAAPGTPIELNLPATTDLFKAVREDRAASWLADLAKPEQPAGP